VVTLVTRNANEVWYRLWRALAESAFGGSPMSGSRSCFGVFDRDLASVVVKIFRRLIYLLKKFYTFCPFSAICKDDAIYCIVLVFNTKILIPVNSYRTFRAAAYKNHQCERKDDAGLRGDGCNYVNLEQELFSFDDCTVHT
jgi:hypothetical protein